MPIEIKRIYDPVDDADGASPQVGRQGLVLEEVDRQLHRPLGPVRDDVLLRADLQPPDGDHRSGRRVDLAFEVVWNHFNGRKLLPLELLDWRLAK